MFAQPSTAVELNNGLLDHASTRKHHKAFAVIGAFDKFHFEARQNVASSETSFLAH
jgi:hypothetical protein